MAALLGAQGRGGSRLGRAVRRRLARRVRPRAGPRRRELLLHRRPNLGQRADLDLPDPFFRQADDRYNSGLFHFKKETGRPELPDDLTLQLSISNAPLQQIIKKLYYPDSPYEFSVLPADILGQVYEQFLGKVIRLTPEHGVEIEEKPEVRKAGGVYYTPTYIVDYIVDHTIGP